MKKLKKLPAIFYATASGKEPVREWLKKLDNEDRKTVGIDIATAEFGWPVGMPLSKKLEPGLYEIRSDISSQRISRIFFTVHNDKMVLLHGFIKKSQKTLKSDLDLARKRRKELLNEQEK